MKHSQTTLDRVAWLQQRAAQENYMALYHRHWVMKYGDFGYDAEMCVRYSETAADYSKRARFIMGID